MKKFTLVFLIFTSVQAVKAQLDFPIVYVNLNRSLTTNFLGGEFQLGNSDEMHFVTAFAGIHFSGYQSSKYCPYYTGTIDLNQFYKFSRYSSFKKGIQAGLGYAYYFKHLKNEQELIPVFGIELIWLRSRDRYQFTYTHDTNGDEQTLPEETTDFTTLAGNLNFGFVYSLDVLLIKGSLAINGLLPVNKADYMPTDHYNIYGSRKLPLAGIEPSIQLSIGFKL